LNIEDTLHGITTPLNINVNSQTLQATGFFYDVLAEMDPNRKGYGWIEVKETWIVSNRHVFLPEIEGKESIPDSITFPMRNIVGSILQWDTITLNHDDIKKRLKLHTDPTVDIATLRISDLIVKRIPADTLYMNLSSVTIHNLPDKCGISAQVADDIIIVGYPRGYYDTYNLFPIVKSGIIASRWGMHFMNKPLFLIDAKLFPGSSGSIVLTKPITSIVTEGPIAGSKEAHFAFLGVFSGEPLIIEKPIDPVDTKITRYHSLNLGFVWYGNLVVDIVDKGTMRF